MERFMPDASAPQVAPDSIDAAQVAARDARRIAEVSRWCVAAACFEAAAREFAEAGLAILASNGDVRSLMKSTDQTVESALLHLERFERAMGITLTAPSGPSWEDLIERCNTFMWVFMYPHGTIFRPACGSHQHRDIVRTFFAGVYEGYLAAGLHAQLERMLPEYQRMTGTGWLPDARFAPPSPATNAAAPAAATEGPN
jgi:hypothetical protein